jgi:hypothetical protein
MAMRRAAEGAPFSRVRAAARVDEGPFAIYYPRLHWVSYTARQSSYRERP